MSLPQKLCCSAAVFLLSAFSICAQSTSFVSSYTSGAASRRDYAGFLGMQFTVGSSPITVSALGRYNPGYDGAVHTVKLVNVQLNADVPGGSAQVAMTSGNAAFQYAPLASPIQLQANTTYQLLSLEQLSGDSFYNIWPVATTSVATVNGAVYSDATGAHILVAGTSGQSYGPVSFLYGSSNPVYPPPTVTVYPPNMYPTTTTPTAVAAQAVANIGTLTGVQFQINGQNYGPLADSTSPGTYYERIPANGFPTGTYSVTAIATDTFGGSTTSAPVPMVYTSTDVPLLNAQILGGIRNNYGNPYGHFVGLQFTVGPQHLQVFGLGRYVAPGNSQPHLLKLVNASTGVDVPGGSLTVSLANATAGQYAYGYFTTPVVLVANQTYDLVSQETAGGDQWYDLAPVTPGSIGTVNAAVYQADSGAFIPVQNTANYSYVPVNLEANPIPGPYTISISLTNVANATYSGIVTLSATINSYNPSLPVSSVQFMVDGQPYGAPVTTNLYSLQVFLDTTQLANGAHTLSVTATDVAGDTGSSATQGFTVNNASAPAGQPFVTSFQTNNVYIRNNFSGFVGMAFTVGSAPLTISSLGRFCIGQSNQAHLLKLVQAPAGTDVPGGAVTLPLTSLCIGQFAYAPLPAPLTLPAGSSYYLASQETANGDNWYDYTPVVTSGGASVTAPAYFDGVNWVKPVVQFPSSSYVPLNFLVSAASSSGGLSVTLAAANGVLAAAPVSNGTVLSVQFQIDGLPIYSAITAAPYSLTIPSLGIGNHKITAVAKDSLGNTATSLPFLVTVPYPPQGNFEVSVLNFSPTTLRNNYTGWVGFRFTTTGSINYFIQPGAVSINCIAGNTQPHVAKVIQVSTGADIGDLWFSPCGSGFTNVLGMPTLQLNTSYYLVVQETAGGDQWYDISPAVPTPFYGGSSTNDVPANFRIDGPVYWDGFKYVEVNLPNYSYVGVMFVGYTALI